MLDLASSKTYLQGLGFVAELEIVGPPTPGGSVASSPLANLAQTAISLAQSESPYSEVVQERDAIATASNPQFHNSETSLRKTASKVLGFTPSTSVSTALKAYTASILRLQSSYLSSKINVACSSPPSIPVLEEGLVALNGCNVQLLTLIEGAYYTLGCSQGLEGQHLEPVAIVPAVPYKEGVRGVEIIAERGLEGKVDIQMRCPVVGGDGKLVPGESETVMWADTVDGGEFAELSKPGAHPIAEWYTVEFAQRDARSFTLTLPPTEGVPEGEEPKRRLTLRDPHGKKSLMFQPTGDEARALVWKFNPICCAASGRRKDVWDFFKEDREPFLPFSLSSFLPSLTFSSLPQLSLPPRSPTPPTTAVQPSASRPSPSSAAKTYEPNTSGSTSSSRASSRPPRGRTKSVTPSTATPCRGERRTSRRARSIARLPSPA